MTVIVPIVEGQGEVQALPNLLYRIARYLQPDAIIRVNNPIRVKSGSFLHDATYFARQMQLAAAKAAQSQGTVLILLDCEDDCPAVLGPDLSRRAQAVRNDVTTVVVLAHREFETWFMTAARSLRGHASLSLELDAPAAPEQTRGAKEWLSRHMSVPYDPIIHQLELTRAFDLDEAQVNPSFARLVQKIRTILSP